MDKPDRSVIEDAKKRVEDARKTPSLVTLLDALRHLDDVEEQLKKDLRRYGEALRAKRKDLRRYWEALRAERAERIRIEQDERRYQEALRAEQAERTRIEQEALRRAIEKGTLLY